MNLRSLCTARSYERGQAIMEMALLVPVLLVLLLGMIEVGRYAAFSIEVANSARAGADYGAQNAGTINNAAGIRNAAIAEAPDLKLTASNVILTSPPYWCVCSNGAASTCLATDCSTSHMLTYVKVTVQDTFTGLFHYPANLNSITVTQTAQVQAPSPLQ